jgi:hypothetical protein
LDLRERREMKELVEPRVYLESKEMLDLTDSPEHLELRE